MTGRHQNGNHFAVQVAPRGFTVHEQNRISIAGAGVQVVNPVIVDFYVMRLKGEIGESGEAFIRRSKNSWVHVSIGLFEGRKIGGIHISRVDMVDNLTVRLGCFRYLLPFWIGHRCGPVLFGGIAALVAMMQIRVLSFCAASCGTQYPMLVM